MFELIFSRKYLKRKIILITPVVTVLVHFYWTKKHASKPIYSYVETPSITYSQTPWTWNPTPKHESLPLQSNKCDKSQIRLNTSDFWPFVEYHRKRSRKVYVPQISEEHKQFMINEYARIRKNMMPKIHNVNKEAVSWLEKGKRVLDNISRAIWGFRGINYCKKCILTCFDVPKRMFIKAANFASYIGSPFYKGANVVVNLAYKALPIAKECYDYMKIVGENCYNNVIKISSIVTDVVSSGVIASTKTIKNGSSIIANIAIGLTRKGVNSLQIINVAICNGFVFLYEQITNWDTRGTLQNLRRGVFYAFEKPINLFIRALGFSNNQITTIEDIQSEVILNGSNNQNNQLSSAYNFESETQNTPFSLRRAMWNCLYNCYSYIYSYFG
ncbi:uncharacterized protein VNE69_10068 [Vairimorpha necatrix]|uniref:Uncharacterized protein n=1 Tax=Vairimorpha necatrix TaxID=6039 RepID=A0AAX4JFJ7_9MICR